MSAAYLEVLEASVSLPEPEVKITDKSHNSSNQADAEEYSCPGAGVERSLEARERVSKVQGAPRSPSHTRAHAVSLVLNCSGPRVSRYMFPRDS